MAAAIAQRIISERKQLYVQSVVDERGKYRTTRTLAKRLQVYSVPGLATLALACWPVYLFANAVFGILPLTAILMFAVLFWHRGFGVTVGFHRLATHGSFKAHWLTKLILWSGGSAAGQGRIGTWRANHEDHHQHPDRVGDPHSPLLNLWYAHFEWLNRYQTPNLAERVREMKQEDRILGFFHNTYIVWLILWFAIPTYLMGWEGLFVSWASLGGVYHITFSVNSACHRWGVRLFNTMDLSTDNWIVGILGLGEGFHNGHHAFPRSALHALKFPWADQSYLLIRVLELVHLAKDVRVRVPNQTQIETKMVQE